MTLRRVLLGATAALALTLTACGGSSSGGTSSAAATDSAAPAATGSIVVGAFNFGESKILANMYAAALGAAGYDASVKELTNREVVEPALESNEIQVVPEYLGTLTEFLNLKVNGPDAAPLASGDVDATYAELQKLAEQVGITVLTPSPAADQNAFAVTREFSEANGITSISQLAEYSATNDVVLGGPPECPDRPFCQPGLEETYGMTIAEFTSLDAGGPLTKQALAQGKIDVGLVFSSDGGVAAQDLVVLTDDKMLQTADNVVAAVNTQAVTPALQEALDAVNAALTTEKLVALNKAVDIDREDPATVAEDWLRSEGLLQ
jgi:osmoprotectant transport system substrate-binding protein